MGQQYSERSEIVDIPKGTGTEGFVRALRAILKLPKVQEIHITSAAQHQIEFMRLVRPEEPMQPLSVDFDSVTPYAILRNLQVTMRELPAHPDDAALSIALLFRQVTFDHLYPVAFVGGTKSEFWGWYQRTTGIELPETDELYGLPFLTDRLVPDDRILLAAASVRGAAIIDAQRSYMIVMMPKLSEVT